MVEKKISTQDIKNAVRAFRANKNAANERGISTEGNKGKQLAPIFSDMDHVINSLWSDNSSWVESKRNQLHSYLEGLEPSRVEDAYRLGLDRALTQTFRLFKKQSTDPAQYFTEDFLRGMIRGYTFDFIRSLSMSEKKDLPAWSAVEIAKMSSRYNPDSYVQLQKTFPNCESRVIVRGMLGYSNDPEGYLANVGLLIQDLSIKYPSSEVSPYIIKIAAIDYPSRAEDFIEKSKKKISILSRKFPLIDDYIVVRAAVHNSDPEAFLTNYAVKVHELSEKYPDINLYFIKTASSGYVNSEDYLKSVRGFLAKFSALYSDVPAYIRKVAVRGRPLNPEEFMKYIIDARADLMNRYPKHLRGLIDDAIINHPSDPEKYLQRQVEFKKVS